MSRSAQIVIVGGGIIGASIAYHLAEMGCDDVVVIERHRLTSGTTWHAAGLVMQLRSSLAMTELCRYGPELFTRLEAETGQQTGFQRRGCLQVARNDQRMIELKRMASLGRRFGVETELVSPDDIPRLHPLTNPDQTVGALFVPGDGQTNPVDTTMAMVKGAKAAGVRFLEGVEVTGFDLDGRRVTAVLTSEGPISCQSVVNCAGVWAREIGALAGVRVPVYAAEHMYVTTEAIADLPGGLPVLRDADGFNYVKEDAGKLLVGSFEPDAKPLPLRNLPDEFEFGELQEDWDQFTLPMSKAIEMVPRLEQAQIRHFMNGPEAFTPDNRFILGPAPERDNFFVAAGFNSQGILSSAGVGRAMAQWILDGAPGLDLAEADISRFHGFQSNQDYLHERTREAVGLLYAMHWPQRQVETARPIRLSPLHFRLEQNNACFGEVTGWERANWYAPSREAAQYEYSYGRQNWFDVVGQEHQAVRERVGLFDLSSFAKTEVRGPDAQEVMQHVATANMAVPIGKTVYTLMLNHAGGIEADVTVTRLADDRYLVVAPAAMQGRIVALLTHHKPAGKMAEIVDVTSGRAVMAVTGPRARDLLSALSPNDLSSEAFPFGTTQEIEIGRCHAMAMRISYVGELGWELYVPTEFAVPLFDRIMECGADHGLRLAGYHALDSLRCEKGYRHWGDDITPADRPNEAGLGFAVSRRKPEAFIGRAAAEAERAAVPKRRLLHFVLEDPEPLLHRDELILHDGKIVGHISSGSYGYTLGAAVGLGYVDLQADMSADDFAASKTIEIEIAGDRVPARASLEPLYDPENLRLKS